MSNVFSIRWHKEPSEVERLAKSIIEQWQEKSIHRDMLFSAVIAYEGQQPMTETGITKYLGQLADKLDSSVNRLERMDFTQVQSNNRVNQVVMEFDPDFDDVMLSEWDD